MRQWTIWQELLFPNLELASIGVIRYWPVQVGLQRGPSKNLTVKWN